MLQQEIYRNEDLLYQTTEHLKEQQRSSKYLVVGALDVHNSVIDSTVVNSVYGRRLGGFPSSSRQPATSIVNERLRGLETFSDGDTMRKLLEEKEVSPCMDS